MLFRRAPGNGKKWKMVLEELFQVLFVFCFFGKQILERSSHRSTSDVCYFKLKGRLSDVSFGFKKMISVCLISVCLIFVVFWDVLDCLLDREWEFDSGAKTTTNELVKWALLNGNTIGTPFNLHQTSLASQISCHMQEKKRDWCDKAVYGKNKRPKIFYKISRLPWKFFTLWYIPFIC